VSSAEDEIRRLLVSLYNYGEMVRFVHAGPHGERLAAKLPITQSSLEDVAAEVVAVYSREGFLDDSFFDRLIRDRPRRGTDIARVQRVWTTKTARSALEPSAELSTRVDALIVTALKDELDALLNVGTRLSADWKPGSDSWGLPYYRGCIVSSRGRSLEIVAAQSSEMGETDAATTATRLICELTEKKSRPRCIAMCGICAGRRDAVRLGDIVVADRLFKFDNGKIEIIKHAGSGGDEITETNVFHDVKTFNLRTVWKRKVETFAGSWIPVVSVPRPKTLDHQRGWLLEKLFAHETSGGLPAHELPERSIQCPSWTRTVTSLLEEGYVVLGPSLALTDFGRKYIERLRVLYPDHWPRDCDHPSIHIGPIGTNARVQKDADLFKSLQKILRTILAVEMEGAAVGCVAEEAGVPCLVAKAVVDHADLEKNDNFRMYSCELSAAFVMAFLLESDVLTASAVRC